MIKKIVAIFFLIYTISIFSTINTFAIESDKQYKLQNKTQEIEKKQYYEQICEFTKLPKEADKTILYIAIGLMASAAAAFGLASLIIFLISPMPALLFAIIYLLYVVIFLGSLIIFTIGIIFLIIYLINLFKEKKKIKTNTIKKN